DREGVLGARHGPPSATTLPGDQLADVLQPVWAGLGELVPDPGQRGMAEAPAMGATHVARGSGARGDRAAGRRGRIAAGSTADPREVRGEVRPRAREEPDDDGRGLQETGGALMAKEYRTITEIAGPLIFVEKTEPVGYNELVEVQLTDGRRKRGQVLDSSTNIV